VEVRLTGTVVGDPSDGPRGTVSVTLRHPRNGSLLVDLYVLADEVEILTQADG
jgi:hypothetical protein